MKANEKLLLRYLEGSDKNFIIPVYQRNYDWKMPQCKQLFDDLIDVINNNFRTHFLGSLVSIYSDDGNQEYLVIDGQQRLTTITLLLLALHNYIIENNIETEPTLCQRIKDEYLINKYAPKEKKLRLKPVKNDKEAFEKLFTDEDNILESNITKNYEYFYNRIAEESIPADSLFKAISKLIIVDIELKKSEDDPQLIFESLNSTGLNLSQSDLVRNYILMKENIQNQFEFYEKYWNRIEVNTSYQTDSFLRNYLTYKMGSIPNKDKVYITFKNYVEKEKNKTDFSMEMFLKELLRFSKYYRSLNNGTFEDENIANLLKEISKLDITVCYPFLLEVFDDLEKEIISKDDLREILSVIISFSFRRSICEVITSALNKLFMSLAREIKKFPDYKDNYLEIFKYVLINKKDSQRFPDDTEFLGMLAAKNLYKMQQKNKLHYFTYMENFENREKVDVVNLLEEGVLTIEHIMPQTLNQKWRDELGSDYQQTHSLYLHTIGNLTLTAYNSKYGNLSFSEKKNIEKGFKESRLYLNSFLQNVEKWDKNAIIERAQMLSKRASKIWKFPECSYMPKKTEDEQTYTVTESLDLAGTKIQYFEMFGEKMKVSTWREFEKEVFYIFHSRNPQLLKDIAGSDFSNLISTSGKNHIRPMQIAENVFIEMNLSTTSILSLVAKLMKKYEINENDLILYVKNKNDCSDKISV